METYQAFLQGDKEEQDRDVYLEPTADLRQRLRIGKESILKLTGSVYGLRNVPRAWYRRVKKDLEALGWRCHQLDQCVFLKYDGNELVGICGVYVDDFIIGGNTTTKKWQKEKRKLKICINGESGKVIHLLCVESTTYRNRITQSKPSITLSIRYNTQQSQDFTLYLGLRIRT